MTVYLDSSVLAGVYLSDEAGHGQAVSLLEDPELGLITGTTGVEVSGALVRAARSGGGDEKGLLALLDADLGVDGPVTVIAAPQEDVEIQALKLVRMHAIGAMDAWHLATARIVLPSLAESGDDVGFATRDQAQSDVARMLGFRSL